MYNLFILIDKKQLNSPKSKSKIEINEVIACIEKLINVHLFRYNIDDFQDEGEKEKKVYWQMFIKLVKENFASIIDGIC